MASSSPLWKKVFDALDERLSPAINEMAQSEDAATLVALGRRGRSELDRRMEQASRRTLHLLNLPAGSDVNRLLEHIARLEREVRDLRNALTDRENAEYLASLARATKQIGQLRSADPRHARREAQVATMPTPTDLLERIRLDVERNALRARNGLKHLAGVGRPAVGCSPKDVVWRRDKVQLYRYHSPGPTLGPPLLLVMSLVSKPYVLDLTPGNSFVEALVGRGFDVYMIDWGTPDAADSGNSFETYCDEYIPFACAAAMRTSGVDELHVFGYCFGGVLSLMFAAGHPEIPLRTLSLMATPIDFAAMGGMTTILARPPGRPVRLPGRDGQCPCRRRAARALVQQRVTGDAAMYANLLEKLENSQYIAAHEAMHGWATDHIPFPGACFRQTAEWLDPRQPARREPPRHGRGRTRSRIDRLPRDERRGHG